MFKLLVVSALFAFAVSAPAPGFLHGGYALPAATSYSSRVDVHHPVVKTVVAAPIITKAVVAAPLHSYHSAPVVSSYGYGLGHGYGIEHGYGIGHGISSGIGLEHGISSDYGLGHGYSLGHGYGLGHGLSSGYGLGYGHGW